MIAPITAFNGMDPSPPISTFFKTHTSSSVTITDLQLERALSIEELQKRVGELHPVIDTALQRHRARGRENSSKGILPNFSTGDFVLVAREDFSSGEKLSLRWRGPRRVVRAINNFVFQVEDLRTGDMDDIHVSRLKFYHDSALDTEVIISHVVQSETGMIVHRLHKLVDTAEAVKVEVRWKGLPGSEDTLGTLKQIYEDVPGLLKKILVRKNTPANLVAKARQLLRL